MGRTFSACRSTRGPWACAGTAAGVIAAAATSTTARAATPPKAAAVLVYDATAPSTGPKSAPTIAAPKAAPISSPRRLVGAAATSQASAPVQENELETPWRKRARSSDHSVVAKPKAIVVTV